MNENIKKRNECLAKTVIKGLDSRNMTGYYAESKEEALKKALELIPEGSTIAMGGCMSCLLYTSLQIQQWIIRWIRMNFC